MDEIDGNAGEAEPRFSTDKLVDDIESTYQKARTELMDTIGRLRNELDRLDLQQTGDRVQVWVKENPALAALLALGGGILVGRVIAEALRPAPPPPVTIRARDKALLLAAGAGSLVADKARHVGETVADRAGDVADVVSRKAGEFGGVLSERASGLGDVLSEKAVEFGEDTVEHVELALHKLQKAAEELASTVKKRTHRPREMGEVVMGAAQAVIAGTIVKKLTDWAKSLT